MNKEQSQKKEAIDILRRRYAEQKEDVEKIDSRLTQYFSDMCEHVSAELGDPNDWSSVYEVLGAIKFLRLLRTYEFDYEKVQKVLRLGEGVWEETNGIWRLVRGGIKQPGTIEPQVYRWEPFQALIFAEVYGFKVWIDTQLTLSDRQTLLPTEKVEDGKILDLRRLCTEYICYTPRKTDKTGIAAFVQFEFFLMEDFNSEILCTANSSDQAKILYRRTKGYVQQIDDGKRIRSTETVIDWRPAFQSVRNSSIRPLSAGGKTKDGMFAQLCCADEYGSAGYTNGKSDMKMLVDVVCSSMGPRREPLLFITTTAGRIKEGPFIEKLDTMHRLLMKELEYERGESQPTLSSDRTLCILFEPDEYERDEEYLLTSKTVRQKVNKMLGKTVQHQFYEDEITKARLEGDTGEVLSKLLNVYQSDTVKEWIKPEEIRDLQRDMKIDDCIADDGWIVFAGLDFSRGDDLNGVSYLAVRFGPRGRREYFADMDSYMSEDAANRSPLRELFYQWADAGYLHIVPGKTFDPSWPVNRIIELDKKGVNFMIFLYDRYNAKIVINSLKEWLFSIGLDPESMVKSVSQTFANYNPVVNEFEHMVRNGTIAPDGNFMPQPLIHFSMNPLWPWEFGNTVLKVTTDGYENAKPVKGTPAGKVDNVQMLLSALIGYDEAEGAINK